jgi:hypothetical protein
LPRSATVLDNLTGYGMQAVILHREPGTAARPAEAQREEKRRLAQERQRAVQQRVAEGDFWTEAISRQVTAYERLLRVSWRTRTYSSA